MKDTRKRTKPRWLLTLLMGTTLGLFSTGCKPECEGVEEFPQEVREGQFAVSDFEEELGHYKRFVREESAGRWVVDTKVQEEKIRSRVEALWEDEDTEGDVMAILRDPLIESYREEWANQGDAFEAAKADLDSALNELETKATTVNDRALSMMSQDACDDEDLGPGLDVYDRYRELKKQHRRVSDVELETSAAFIEEIIAELRLRDGDEEEAPEDEPLDDPGPDIEVTIIEPDEVDGCEVGGWIFGRLVVVNGHTLVVSTAQRYHCPEVVLDENGNNIGWVEVDAEGNRVVMDATTGQPTDIPAPACIPNSTDRQLAIDASEANLLDELRRELADREGGMGAEVMVDGESVTISEVTFEHLSQETTAKTMVEVCQSELEDPEALAAKREQLNRSLADMAGVDYEELEGMEIGD